MDNSSAGGGRQTARQRELHGPRPAPLTVKKESRKIKKSPVALPPPPQQQQQHRRPVIIYTVSPKVIHTTPADFMSTVQSLTGGRATTASDRDGNRGPAPFSPEQRRGGGGILSPGPASLPWISPAIFTPTAIFTPPEIQFIASPNSNLFFSGTGMVPSPTAYRDLFVNYYQH
ncbi:protein MKS1-like [Zingiber officinale]|uniref:VQ domain-containing protein n=1 Tax=Zingiber officinale TaxID=94328 RepID=A0A8J5LEV8_ZINOF|nr:protein MKS1-like [Zingiber officinale]KAG6511947.1 hypothetical protein ZIOFF_030026 [Zingiber officinale]